MEVVLAGPGTVLAGRYTLERELGRGGMAIVYLALDQRHHRAVAVKILRPQIAAYLGSDRFLREIEIAARLTHPHILPLHDSGESDDLLYYVMPFVEGESVRERLAREGPVPLENALRITREVADALAYAHAHGIVHRDIKPGNILLESGHAVVADFGIARAINSAGVEDITTSGLIVGTPVYMSPEQVSGSPVDGRSDLYSLGCVLYEMLTGSPPFSGATPQALAALHVHERPLSLEVVLPSTPPAVVSAVDMLLQKNPEDRFATADQFLDALTGATPLPARPGARLRRRRVAAAGAAAVLLALPLAFRRPEVSLDPGRVVVYPITMAAAKANSLAPDEVTLALLASINSTASLAGIDGGRLPRAVEVGAGDDAAGERIARQQRAGFFISGRILAPDSLHLVLDLHDLRGGSITHRTLDFAPGSNGWAIGVRAALELLPVLIPTGGGQDLPSLEGRSPRAMAAYFSGERAYRSAAFEEALGNFRTAVQIDSSFALAALRGAIVASWSDHPKEALAMARAALDRKGTLPPRLAHLAHGLEHLMAGRADSAVDRFRHTIALDPENVEAWMGLAETYHHLLPRQPQLDSLAEDAFRTVRRLDPRFAPALYHLIEYAVRRGDVAGSERMLEQFAGGHPDSSALGPVRLMLECARGDMTGAKWQAVALGNPVQALAAGQLFAVGGLRQPDCAQAAFEAVLGFDTTTGSQRSRNQFGALVGLQSVLVARNRNQAARALLESDTLFNPSYRGNLYLLSAVAGGPFEKEADAFAQAQLAHFRREPSSLSSVNLWFLGGWQAHRGRGEVASEIADSIASRNARAGTRRDRLFVASLRAQATLARGDSSAALAQLRALVPTADDWTALAWNPWESLATERLLLARLLLSKGAALAALQVASNFDAPSPVTYLPYLPASLAVRIEAAERLGEEKLAERFRRRREILQSNHH